MVIIDLNVPMRNFDTEPFPSYITHTDHSAGARRLGKTFGVDPTSFPGGMALASDQVELSTHSGTHVDSPWHFGPETNGVKSKTIDKIPLEWCIGPGVILDFTHKKAGEVITLDDAKAALDKIEYQLKPGDIVLIHTGTDKLWGTLKYVDGQPGVSREATVYFIDQGVRNMGIDAWGWDIPGKNMVERYKAGDKNALWPSHFLGREREYIHIEKLANLEKVPKKFGFTFAAFPVLIENASAGWCRAVAMLD